MSKIPVAIPRSNSRPITVSVFTRVPTTHQGGRRFNSCASQGQSAWMHIHRDVLARHAELVDALDFTKNQTHYAFDGAHDSEPPGPSVSAREQLNPTVRVAV